jgi:general nucleoside transport system ATP-binding protein
VLEVKDLCADRDNGLPAVRSASFTVHSGEIVGIAGVSGNGQRELVEVLAGQRPRHSGDIFVNGTPYQSTRREMARHQVYTLPEEPLRNACVPHMSVAENMALRTFDCPPQARQGWLLSLSNIRRMAEGLVKVFSVKTPSVDTPVGHLSGGNVQRTVLARELVLYHHQPADCRQPLLWPRLFGGRLHSQPDSRRPQSRCGGAAGERRFG